MASFGSIVALALPALPALTLQPVFNIAESALVGHSALGSEGLASTVWPRPRYMKHQWWYGAKGLTKPTKRVVRDPGHGRDHQTVFDTQTTDIKRL